MPKTLPIELLTIPNMNRVSCRVFRVTGIYSLHMMPDEAVLYDGVTDILGEAPKMHKTIRREPCPQDSLRWIIWDAYTVFYDSRARYRQPYSEPVFHRALTALLGWFDEPCHTYNTLFRAYTDLLVSRGDQHNDPLLYMLFGILLHHPNRTDYSGVIPLPRNKTWHNATYGVVADIYDDITLLNAMLGTTMNQQHARQLDMTQVPLRRCDLYRLLSGHLPDIRAIEP